MGEPTTLAAFNGVAQPIVSWVLRKPFKGATLGWKALRREISNLIVAIIVGAEMLPEDTIFDCLSLGLGEVRVAYLLPTVATIIAHVIVHYIGFEPTGGDFTVAFLQYAVRGEHLVNRGQVFPVEHLFHVTADVCLVLFVDTRCPPLLPVDRKARPD
jgi:hypothetical protein